MATDRGAASIQRVAALNLLLDDLYHGQRILARRGACRPTWCSATRNFRPEMQGLDLPYGTYVHICGTDIVRDADGRFLVLEDNARTPSGVSLRGREPPHDAARLPRPDATGCALRAIDSYGLQLIAALREVAPAAAVDPVRSCCCRPAVYNSAYLRARVPGPRDGRAAGRGARPRGRRTTGSTCAPSAASARVDVIYRRINDDFLDPEAFRPDSMLGVPGLMRAYRAGNVALANAVGTGVADDKAVYAYMPRIIRYYLGRGADPAECRDPYLPRGRRVSPTRSTISTELVVKPVGESGGYGITIGPARQPRPSWRNAARGCSPTRPTTSASPASSLSVAPTLVDGAVRAAARRSAALRGHRARRPGCCPAA